MIIVDCLIHIWQQTQPYSSPILLTIFYSEENVLIYFLANLSKSENIKNTLIVIKWMYSLKNLELETVIVSDSHSVSRLTKLFPNKFLDLAQGSPTFLGWRPNGKGTGTFTHTCVRRQMWLHAYEWGLEHVCPANGVSSTGAERSAWLAPACGSWPC